MWRLFLILSAGICGLVLAQTVPPSGIVTTAPATNWVLPIFTDREGYRSMTLRGSAVQPAGANVVAVKDLNITVFSGDEKAAVDWVLLSTSAEFFPKQNRASGEKSVRVIGDDIDVTGEQWTYDHTTKKVSIDQNVRFVFRTQMKDILK